MIWKGVAPMDSAASTRPKSTSRMDVSTRRLRKGMATMVKGTQAAVVPMDVPAMRRVSGMMATMRMMNGMERMMLTIVPRI